VRYLPHTEEEVREMLSVLGESSLDDIFSMVPPGNRFAGKFDLPQPMTEWELNRHMDELAAANKSADRNKIFIGAGSYQHYIPEAVNSLISRSEFMTAYTPYQPEISQGTLQGIFEYQSLVARLLRLDVANASLYDGATALAEALLMAIRVTKRRVVALSKAIHPLYRQVVATYFAPTGYEVVEIPYLENGRSDMSALPDLGSLAAVAVQSPNFFGVIEDLEAVGKQLADEKTLFITCFSEPLAYGLLRSPGSCGADIACGEGQSFGIPQSFGGPGLGMFACREKFMRNLPGRLVGQTTDVEGKRGFVLTLATREQHIRREKATSNICSNQGLCAMASAIYMATVGGAGIRELACLNRDKSEYLKQQLQQKGYRIVFDSPTFNEFVVDFSTGFDKRYEALLEKGFMAGLPLGEYYPELAGCYLICVTETMEKRDMDNLIKEIS
jgi:glycine cleavage system P protein (glycine dehydrogenase) subunit 1